MFLLLFIYGSFLYDYFKEGLLGLNYDEASDAFFPNLLINEITWLCFIEANGSSPIMPSTHFIFASIPCTNCNTHELLWSNDDQISSFNLLNFFILLILIIH